MTNDEAREYFKKFGLTYDVLNQDNIKLLIELIDVNMVASGCLRGEFRCNKRYKTYKNSRCVEITCRAGYFKKREAVTFNDDGFIGFAGWASTVNVQPILTAFITWCDRMKGAAE